MGMAAGSVDQDYIPGIPSVDQHHSAILGTGVHGLGDLLIKEYPFEGALEIVVHQGYYSVSSIVLVVAVHGFFRGWQSCWRAG